jgi:hypothetical protein
MLACRGQGRTHRWVKWVALHRARAAAVCEGPALRNRARVCGRDADGACGDQLRQERHGRGDCAAQPALADVRVHAEWSAP